MARPAGARLLVLLATVALLPPAAAAAADGEVFRFRDPAIVESSALVDLGSIVVTANDSGNPPNLYAVDPRTGETVGVTSLQVRDFDIEALATVRPRGGGSRVWVGDIGDNDRERSSISVYLAPVGASSEAVTPQVYDLVYPDGAHDAESLFADTSGRLHVITKRVTGGTVYRAPARLDARRDNRLERVAHILDFATDAAMLRDGKHLVVRGYDHAAVFTFPDFRRLGSFDLPAQELGEGISVGPDGRILISSEGQRAPVFEISLPPDIRAAVVGDASPSSPEDAVVPPPRSVQQTRSEETGFPDWLLWSIPLVVLVGGVGVSVGQRKRHS